MTRTPIINRLPSTIFCVKRDLYYDFIRLSDNMKQDGSCKNGYFKCPKHSKDNSLAVCMPTHECPVSAYDFTSYKPRFGTGPALSQLIASSTKVCKAGDRVGFWGPVIETFWLNTTDIPGISFDCNPKDEDKDFQKIVGLLCRYC